MRKLLASLALLLPLLSQGQPIRVLQNYWTTNRDPELTFTNVLVPTNSFWIQQRQWGTANLSNWSMLPTNIVGSLPVGILTNANAFQPASRVLTNLSGTGANTNIYVAGPNVTLTPNGNVVTISAALAGGTVSGEDATNISRYFATNSAIITSNSVPGTVGAILVSSNFLQSLNGAQPTNNNLTLWGLYSTNVVGSTASNAARAILVSSNFLQSLNGSQPTNNVLTLLSGTRALTNASGANGIAVAIINDRLWITNTGSTVSGITNINSVVSNAISLLYSSNATTLFKQVSNGANVTITDRGTYLEFSASLAGGTASMADVTNVVQSYVGQNATNVNVTALGYLTNQIALRQPASDNLTNWALFSTNVVGNTASNSARAILVSSNFLQSLNGAQPTNNTLTLLAGTGALTNATAFQPSNSNLTNLAALANATGMLTNNGAGVLGYMTIPTGGSGANANTNNYVAGTNIVITTNASSVSIATVGGPTAVIGPFPSVAEVDASVIAQGAANTNHALSVGTTVSNGVVSLIEAMGGGDVLTSQLLTVSNQVQATSNRLEAAKQPTNENLTLYAAQTPTAFSNAARSGLLSSLNGAQPTNNVLTMVNAVSATNQPSGGTNMSVRRAGGTNFFDTTGELNNWALYSTNAISSTAQAIASVTTNSSLFRTNDNSIKPSSGTLTVDGIVSASSFQGPATGQGTLSVKGLIASETNNANYMMVTNELTVGNTNVIGALANLNGQSNNVASLLKFATNVAWNVNLPLSGSLVAITNTLGGSTANLWLTNVVDGGWFTARILADGTARTVSITNASGLTLTVISTNGFSSVGTIPTVSITASKLAIICGRSTVVAGTTNVDLWAAVQP